MKEYGHFDDSAREYVISDPKTPWPWINYLGNKEFFSLISNTAGGYSFYKDAKFRRITRYRYNDVPMDSVGRYFYINDGGKVWSPGWKPCKTALDSYECRHGMGYTRITGALDGLEVSELFFVPLDDNCEVQKVTFRNLSDRERTFKLFSYAEWCLWNAQTDGENFQRNLSTGEVEVHYPVREDLDDWLLLIHKTEYKERRNHFSFYAVNDASAGFDTDRESFVGLYNGLEAPQNVLAGEPSGSIAHGWSPVASHCLTITLQPGESDERIFVLGYIENPQDEKFDEAGTAEVNSSHMFKDWHYASHGPLASPLVNQKRALDMIARYNTSALVDEAFAALGRYWDDLLSRFNVSSCENGLDRMVNIWNQYQCMVTFNMSRSASFFESGIGRGMGFRDSNQDLVGFVHQIPERARERIIDIASTQFPDGGCYHQYQPLTKRGNNDIGGGFNDDPMWLIFGTVAYLKETGDFSILDELVPFDNEPGSEVTLLEHLRISFDHVVNNLGPHSLPLIGRADWNDCLNLNCFSNDPNDSFQTTENKTEGSKAESLMIAGLFVVCGRDYADLCRTLAARGCSAAAQEACRADALVEAMCQSVKQYGWDGEWFLRAYDFFGNPIGSKANDEGKIFIESQGWCTMARIGADEGMCDLALDSVKKYLDSENGIVLNNPAYTRYKIEFGEISSYPAGYKENAGIFCHNNPWVIIGETEAGRGDDAWEHYRKISPAYIKDQTLHKIEPYVYSQMVAGKDAVKPGEGKNSWLTGTAAWNWYAATQFILGIKPCYDGLEVDPCIPAGWKGFTVRRKFRDAVYTIRVTNPDGICRGKKVFIPYSPGEHEIDVVMRK